MKTVGSPPCWKDTSLPFKLPNDIDNSKIRTAGIQRLPKHSFIPLFISVDRLSPDFDWTSIDIVTDRNCLRNLLRWTQHPLRADTRMDLLLAGDHTVLLMKAEMNSEVHYPGWGINFENFTTVPSESCEESTAHHRIISYVRLPLHTIVFLMQLRNSNRISGDSG